MKKPMRNALSLLLGASLAAGAGMTSAAAAFVDTDGHWGADAINRWSGCGVVNGQGNGVFAPAASMTRAEMAQMMANLLHLEEKADISAYTDVPADAWYADAIAKCVAAGILKGMGGNLMYPGLEIPREQVFVMFARAMGIDEQAVSRSKFTDSDKISDWAEGSINALANYGYISGLGGGVLAPLDSIDRASAMALLDKSIGAYAYEDGETVEGTDDGRMTLVVADEATVTGEMERLVVAGAGASVTVSDAVVGEIAILEKDASVSLEGSSEAQVITVHESAANAEISVGTQSSVAGLVSHGDGVQVSGDGKLDSAVIHGNNNSVNTNGTKVEVSDSVTGTTVGGSAVDGGTVVAPSEKGSTVTSNIGGVTFQAGVPAEFTVTTKPGDDAGTMVKGTFTFSDPEAIGKLEYFETSDSQWHTFSGDFGPEGGFPLAEATSRFRVTFRTAGSYDLTVAIKAVDGGEILCSTDLKVTVEQAEETAALVDSAESFREAVSAGKDILLTGSFTTDSELKVDKAITVDGNGFTITSTNETTGTDGAAGIQVIAGAVLKNLTVSGPNKTGEGWDNGQYGIKIYNVDGVVLENVKVTAANAGIQVNSSQVTMKGTIDVSGNEWGGIEVGHGSGLEKGGSLDITGATLVHGDESFKNPVLWIDGKDTCTLTGGEKLYAVAASGTKTHYYINNYIGKAIAAAGEYTYNDAYQYRGEFVSTEEGKVITVSAAYTAENAAQDSGKAVLNDMARFLGALHRHDDGATIKTIVFDGKTYTWDAEGVLLGSNWKNEGTTLVSVITTKALTGAKTFDLLIEDVTLRLTYTVAE